MLDSALDGVITIDHEGRILEFNAAAERIFGQAARTAIGEELADLVIPPSLRERHRATLLRCVETGEVRSSAVGSSSRVCAPTAASFRWSWQ